MHDTRKEPSPSARTAAARPLAGPGLDAAYPGGDAGPDTLAFLRGFFRDPNGVGSVVPSSRWLEQRVVRNVRAADARCVVELGPGTGGTTRALLRVMSPQARMLAIELDPQFHAFVSANIRDARLHVECASAERLGELLESHRLPAPEAIVSGIPFSTMPADVGDRIAAQIGQVLAPGGRFVAYQWTPVVADRLLPYLGRPIREWEPLNLPPMRVFTWVKPARGPAGAGAHPA